MPKENIENELRTLRQSFQGENTYHAHRQLQHQEFEGEVRDGSADENGYHVSVKRCAGVEKRGYQNGDDGKWNHVNV